MDIASFTNADLDPSAVTDALDGAGFRIESPRKFRRTLLDTFDGRLHAAGLRLEVRGTDVLELVLVDRASPPARVATAGIPRLLDDLPVGPLRARLAPVMEVRALLPLATVSGMQRSAVRRDGHGKIRVTVALEERLEIENGKPMTPAWVAEVGELAGYAKEAERTRDLLVSLGLQRHDGDVVDLAATAAGIDLRGTVGSPTVPLDPGETALAGFRRVLDNLADAVEVNWQGTVDDLDPEFLHDFRVAVRRTRSVLAQGKRVLPDGVRDRYREGFGWLGMVTGPARDLDVYVIEWDRYVAPLAADASQALLPVLDHISGRRSVEHAALAEVLRSKRYATLLVEWRSWLGGAGPAADGDKDALRPIGRVAADRTRSAQRQLLERGRAIGPSSPAEDLHELRKDAKKLRYLLECFGSVFAPVPRKAFVQRLKALQDNLGEHQDAEVHVAQLREISHDLHASASAGPDTLVAMGQLTEHLEGRRRAARLDFARRFQAYDTKQTSRTFDEALAPATDR